MIQLVANGWAFGYMEQMSDLVFKLCPFCGGQPLPTQVPHGHGTAYFFRCRSCACEGPWAKSALAAVRLWNQREDVLQTPQRDTLLAIAQHLASLSASTIQLHAGEMTAQEMRSVKAVLTWQAAELMRRAVDEHHEPDAPIAG